MWNMFCDYENSRRVITERELFDILSVALKFTSKVFRAYNEGSNTAPLGLSKLIFFSLYNASLIA